MQAGNLAARYGVHLALEANPPMYTNYLNGTADAFALVKRLDNPACRSIWTCPPCWRRESTCRASLMICSMSAMSTSVSRVWSRLSAAPSTRSWRCCWGLSATALRLRRDGPHRRGYDPPHDGLYRGGVRMIEYERTNLNGVPDYTAVEFEAAAMTTAC